VKVQEWARAEDARVVVVFDGRDAAGKGSTIKRVGEYLNPLRLPHRPPSTGHRCSPRDQLTYVPEHTASPER
jgi:hypothetical protein